MKFRIDYSVRIHVRTLEEYIICNHLNKSNVTMKIHTNLFIKNSFLCYLHNNLIELLVYHTEIFEAFFPL
jgi:hypothetical protein